MNKAAKGAYNEIVAIKWLMEKGYSVFRNVSFHGPVDLIAMLGSEVTLIDVKAAITYNGRRMPPPHLTKEQVTLGVKTVAVYSDGACVMSLDQASPRPFRPRLPARLRHVSYQRICKKCVQMFETRHGRTKFCCSKCRSQYHAAKVAPARAINGRTVAKIALS